MSSAEVVLQHGVVPDHRDRIAHLTYGNAAGNARDFEIFRDALARELREIVDAIPQDDLAIQWDMARETAAVEGVEFRLPDADSGHYVPSKDLGTAVSLLNRATRACGRRLDFAQAPVQFSKGSEDAHYEPLRSLDIGDARMYLRLIDPIDGIEGALQRIEVAQRHRADIGLATACGRGRRPLGESVEDLLRLERDVVERVSAGAV